MGACLSSPTTDGAGALMPPDDSPHLEPKRVLAPGLTKGDSPRDLGDRLEGPGKNATAAAAAARRASGQAQPIAVKDDTPSAAIDSSNAFSSQIQSNVSRGSAPGAAPVTPTSNSSLGSPPAHSAAPMHTPISSAISSTHPYGYVPTRSSLEVPCPMPQNEQLRLKLLRHHRILESGIDGRLDNITSLVASIFRVPFCGIILVEELECKSRSAFGYPITLCTPRGVAMCSWSLVHGVNDIFVAENAAEDPRFCHNPVVCGEPYIKFYAGAPLRSFDGVKLGNLCLMDTVPKKLHASEGVILGNFAEMCVRVIEEERLLQEQTALMGAAVEQNLRLTRAVEGLQEAVMLVMVDGRDWTVKYSNGQACSLIGLAKGSVEGTDFWAHFLDTRRSASGASSSFGEAVRNKVTFSVSASATLPDGSQAQFDLRLKPADEPMDFSSATIGTSQAAALSRDNIGDATYYLVTITPYSDEPLGSNPNSRSSANQSSLPLGSSLGSATVSSTILGVGSSSYAGGIAQLQNQGSATAQAHAVGRALQPVTEPFVDVKLLNLVGKGGFGRVHKGLWDGSYVAVKVIESPARFLLADREDAGKSQNPILEAVLSMYISHPNVVQSYKYATRAIQKPATAALATHHEGHGEGPGHSPTPEGDAEGAAGEEMHETWIVSEFCDHGSLHESVVKGAFVHRDKEGKAAPRPKMAPILHTLRELCSGLNYIHARGLIHGDLSANNVLLLSSSVEEKGFVAKISDFGLSRVIQGDVIRTQNFGTCTHAAPEVLLDGIVSKAADVFAVGVIMNQLCTGRGNPWGRHLNHAQIIHTIISKKPLEFPEATPEEFVRLATRCMSDRPEERPTPAELVRDLQDMIERYCEPRKSNWHV